MRLSGGAEEEGPPLWGEEEGPVINDGESDEK
jgi:hypothetical protein